MEVGVEADELVRVDGDGEVDGALPVVGHHHVEDGDGFLTDGLLAGEVDEELSGHHRGVLRIDGVVLTHSIGVDRVDELLGRQIVDRLIDAGDGLRAWVVAAEPLEGLVEIHLLHALDEVGVVAGALDVLGARPGDGQRIGVVSLTLHLIRVPVCLQVAGVADAHIGANAFHLLGIPKREGVVVAVGEDHGVRLARLEVVGAKVAAHVAARAVVVVPVLSGHLQRYEHAKHRGDGSGCNARQLAIFLYRPCDGSDAQSDPNAEGIERSGVGVVALTRLVGRLVQIKHDGDAGHEEE